MQKLFLNHFWHRIQGWPNEFPQLYAQMVANHNDGAHFVEVGAWKGASTAAMAVEIVNSGKNIKFDVVDTWEGSEEHQAGAGLEDPDVVNNRLYETFLKNMQPVIDYINPIRMTSVEASKIYADNSLDFVAIDASHDYENVKLDILSWLPKVKPGSILAGDDYPWEGVSQAVNELLPGFKHSHAAWWYIKPE